MQHLVQEHRADHPCRVRENEIEIALALLDAHMLAFREVVVGVHGEARPAEPAGGFEPTHFVGLRDVAAYTASKFGVAGLTKALALEWARHGVCVNAIAPGVFPTALNRHLLEGSERGREFILRTPMGRFGKVEELAGAAVFLSSEAAGFVCGEILVVDGGLLASGVNV